MSYERLTKQGGFTADLDLTQEYGYQHIYNRLAELEDKLESGTLVELPCEVGDTVYCVDDHIAEFDKVEKYVVEEIRLTENGIQIWFKGGGYVLDSHFGDCCFLDKTQAEAKLKELRGKGL